MPPKKIRRRLSVIISVIAALLCLSWCRCDKILHRHKRFLYYPFGGTFKMVLGFAVPVPLGLKQNMACGWNFQFQYALPQTTNDTRFYPPIIMARSRAKRDGFTSDRALAYEGFEAILDRNGLNGRACLLRSICENAISTTFHEANGLCGHLLHIFLTPDYEDETEMDPNLDVTYFDAKDAGKFGVDCQTLYNECQKGSGIFDMISVLD